VSRTTARARTTPKVQIKLASVEVLALDLPMIASFKTAHGTTTKKRTVIIRAEDADGTVGWGESPGMDLPIYSADTYDGNWYALTRLLVLAVGDLAVVHVTLHMALRDVFRHLTTAALLEKIHLLHQVMGTLCKHRPRLVVAALNLLRVFVLSAVPELAEGTRMAVLDDPALPPYSMRLMRDGTQVYKGKVTSLKRFKDDASEVRNGMECGIGISNFNDLKKGDVIEAFLTEKIAAEMGVA